MKASTHRSGMQIADLLTIALRRKWLVAATALTVSALVLLMTLSTAPLYEARASLAIDHGEKPVPFNGSDHDQVEYNLQYSIMNTQRDLLLSNDVLQNAFKNSSLGTNPIYRHNPVDVMRSRLRVTTSRDTQVMTVALRDEQAPRAEQALKAILTSFIDSEKERQTFRGDDAVAFLTQQVKESTDRIEGLRTLEQNFQTEKGILSTDPDHNFLVEELTELRSKAADLDVRIIASQALVGQVNAARALPPAERMRGLMTVDAISLAPAVVEQQRLLTELQTKQVELSQKYLPKHPRMIEISQMVAAKQAQLATAVDVVTDGILATNLDLQEQASRLHAQILQKEHELGEYRRNLISIQMMDERTKSQEKVHDQLLTRLNEEQVSSRLDQPQVMVVDPPTASAQPVNIKRMLFGVCALGFGAIAGLFAPVIVELFDFRVRGPLNVQEITGLPILAEIPRIDGLVSPNRQGNRSWPLAFDEAFRALRTSLRFSQQEDKPCQVLMVASASPGDGRSTVAVRLALSLASIGHYVLLIDADMRNPTLHEHLGQSNENGLSFMLAHRGGDVSVATVHEHLDFLGVGVRPPNPADMLHRRQFKRLIQDCRANYDYIILDSPPIDLVSDALAIGEHVDGVVLVARDNGTPKASLVRAVNNLAPLGNKIIGVVLNAKKRVLPLERQLRYEGRGDIELANEEMLKINNEHPIAPSGIMPLASVGPTMTGKGIRS